MLAFIGFFTAAPVVASPDIQVCFTPEYGSTPSCTQDIVNAIDSARHTILVQAYSFTSAPDDHASCKGLGCYFVPRRLNLIVVVF